MWNCPQCGYFNEDNAAECISCGRGKGQQEAARQQEGGVFDTAKDNGDAGGSRAFMPATGGDFSQVSPVSIDTFGQGANSAVYADIKDYLILSVLMIIFCCLPFGAAGLVFSIKVREHKKAGNIEAAMRASKNARICLIAGLLGGAALNIFVFASGFISEIAGSF